MSQINKSIIRFIDNVLMSNTDKITNILSPPFNEWSLNNQRIRIKNETINVISLMRHYFITQFLFELKNYKLNNTQYENLYLILFNIANDELNVADFKYFSIILNRLFEEIIK